MLTDSGAVVTADLFTPNIPPAGGTYMGYTTTGRKALPSDLHFTDLDGYGVARTRIQRGNDSGRSGKLTVLKRIGERWV